MFKQKALFSALCECPVKLDIDKTLKIVLGLWESQLFPAQEAVKHSLIMQKTLLLWYPNQIHRTNARQYIHCFLESLCTKMPFIPFRQSCFYTVSVKKWSLKPWKLSSHTREIKIGKKPPQPNLRILMFRLFSVCCSFKYLILNAYPSWKQH